MPFPALRRTVQAALLALLSAVLVAGLTTPATAAPAAAPGKSDCAGRSVPVSKTSIQLWTFAEHIGFGTDAATQARHEDVLRRLAEMGYRNVEPFTFNGLTAAEYRDLLDRYGLKASGRHVSVGTPEEPVDIAAVLADNKALGLEHFGSGATPKYTTEAQWAAYAAYLQQVGEQARQAGQTLMVHNHDWEFAALDTGRTGYDVLLEGTRKQDVVMQLDVYWAAFAGVDPVELLREHGDRVRLLHAKDLNADLGDRIEIVGRGDLDMPAILAAAGGRSTRYVVVEHDPRWGDPTFDPFVAAQEGFTHLTCTRY